MGKPLRIAFMLDTLCIRGTEANTWALAHYNEVMLGNESIVIVRNIHVDITKPDFQPEVQAFFTRRFPHLYQLPDHAIEPKLAELQVDAMMFGCQGLPTDFYPRNVPTLSHCVFLNAPLGTVHTAVSETVARGCCRVMPNIVHLGDPAKGGDIRAELGIPSDATVFGRYGGYKQFDIEYVRKVVLHVAHDFPHIHFMFMNTEPFVPAGVHLPNLHFLPGTPDLDRKASFVQACDAMLHARSDGETFGMACGEFAIRGRPVLTTRTGATAHIDHHLREKAILYHSPEFLYYILANYRTDVMRHWMDGNEYLRFLPEKVMPQFASLLQEAIDTFAARKAAASQEA